MDKQMNIAVQKTLMAIGMPHNLKGYTYVISALEKCLDDRNKIYGITKGLYVEIATENGDTPSSVERVIRHAIEVSWERGNSAVINKMFGYTISNKKGKPTNSEFIAYLTDFISLHLEEIVNEDYKW